MPRHFHTHLHRFASILKQQYKAYKAVVVSNKKHKHKQKQQKNKHNNTTKKQQ